MKTLLSKGSTNAKTIKNDYETYILYMSPFTQNDKNINLCPFATNGCKEACLYSAGRGSFSNVKQARINKSNYFVNNKEGFLTQLKQELSKINNKAVKQNKVVYVRLNGTTDINWSKLIDMRKYSNIHFYDYTKGIKRAYNVKLMNEYTTLINYTVAYSYNERTTVKDIIDLCNNGINVAVVFNCTTLPINYKGIKVVDGDKTDLEMIKHNGVILGLTAKGKAKKDSSGFVINL